MTARNTPKATALTFITTAYVIVASSSGHCAEMPVYGPVDPDRTQPTDPQAEAARANEDRRLRHLDHTIDAFEVTYQLLNILDAAQTISCVHKTNCHEVNPILGARPSTGKVIGFKLAAGALHFAAARFAFRNSKNNALIFEVASTAIQGVICGLNFRYAF